MILLKMVFAALTSLLLTLFLGPLAIRCLGSLRTGKSIRVLDLHENKQATPTMGGLMFLGATIISVLIWGDLSSMKTLILLATTLIVGTLGAIDDFLKIKRQNSEGVRGRVKMVVLLLIGAGVACYMLFTNKGNATEYFIPFWKGAIVFPVALSFFVTLFVVSGTANAVNLTDGLDGLATITSMLVALVLGIAGSGEIGLFLFAIFGALLGFLWFNAHPAQIFMGDTGSLTLGAIFGVAAVLLRQEFLLALVGGVFVLEAVSVILQVGSYKLRGGKRIFLCAPIHHHFERKGMAETKVVARFAIVGLLLAVIGLISLKMQ